MTLIKKGKTITFEIRAWWNSEDRTIHLASDASKTFILTVNDDRTKARGHRKLFRELAKLLRTAGAPAPE
jgi:hypothetical protein